MFRAVGVVLATMASLLVVVPTASAATTFTVLQLNLCHGGTAGCYTPDDVSISSAVGAINTRWPDVVFLNEICEGDIAKIRSGTPRMKIGIFKPALTPSGTSFKCTDGQDYGNGILAAKPPAGDSNNMSNAYTAQNPGTTELRTWACTHLGWGLACVTHLANNNAPVAMAQCNELMRTNVPNYRNQEGAALPVIASGDLNLKYDPKSAYNVQKCVPAGFFRKGDGVVQHVIASKDFHFVSTGVVTIQGTDHVGFLVTYTLPS